MGFSLVQNGGGRPAQGGSVAALVASVHHNRTSDTLTALWRHVLKLPVWHIAVKGKLPDARPDMVCIDDRFMALAFTSRRTARTYHEEDADRDDGRLLAMPPAEAIRLLSAMSEFGVYGVLFDECSHGFYAPIDSLAEMKRHFEGDGGSGPNCFCGVRGVDFDALVRAGNGDPRHPDDATLRALLRLNDWWFACDPQNPDAIAVSRYHGTSAVLAFTDDWQALRGIERFSLAADDNAVLLLQLGVTDARRWLRGFTSRGVPLIAFNAAGAPVILDIASLDELHAAHGT